jgi:site-specific DNA-methyltransferase (adenine-specific)
MNEGLPKPYYQDEAVTIYHADCREILPLIEFSLIITDPPYGINWNTDYTRFTHALTEAPRVNHPKVKGDTDPYLVDVVFGPWELICWGAHLFPWKITTAGSWLVWDKRFDNGSAFLSDAELAYWSVGKGVYIHKHTWQGMVKDKSGIPSKHYHPTEKPLGLMSWCIEKAKSKKVICDPFMGSGTTLRAAKNLGRKAIGIEIEEKYCEIAAKRMGQGVLL